MSLLNKLFRRNHRKDVDEFKESHYCAVINNQYSWHNSKSEMLDYIDSYSQKNVIYSLTMFRYDMFNLKY